MDNKFPTIDYQDTLERLRICLKAWPMCDCGTSKSCDRCEAEYLLQEALGDDNESQ